MPILTWLYLNNEIQKAIQTYSPFAIIGSIGVCYLLLLVVLPHH